MEGVYEENQSSTAYGDSVCNGRVLHYSCNEQSGKEGTAITELDSWDYDIGWLSEPLCCRICSDLSLLLSVSQEEIIVRRIIISVTMKNSKNGTLLILMWRGRFGS